MPISKHGKKNPRKKVTSSASFKGHEVVFMKHPFSTLPRDVVIKGLLETGKKNIEEFPSLLPQAFFSFIFPTLADLLDGDNRAMMSYREQRAMFLESEISELFTKAFPDCEISSGYKW